MRATVARGLLLLVLVAAPGDATSPATTHPVEGFAELIAADNTGDRPTARSLEVRSPSSWAFGRDGSQTVTWETAPVPADLAQDEVTFVWSAGLSGDPGSHELALDGQRLLEFASGPFRESQEWQEDGIRLRFEPGLTFWRGEVHGTMHLSMPRQRLTPGRPARLTVRALDGRGWFMLHHFTDSHAFAQSSRVLLPSGRRLIVTPPKSLYLPPASIGWTAPFALSDDEAVSEDIDLTAELLDEAGGPVVDIHRQTLSTQARDRALDLSLWSSDTLPVGTWQLRLSLAAPGGPVAGTWKGAVTIGDVSAFEAAEAKAQAAVRRAAARADSGSVLGDISLPSIAWALQHTRRQLMELVDPDRFAQQYDVLLDTVRAVQAAADRIATGQDPYTGHTGYAVKAYRATWDDELQPYGLYVPADYDSARRWPLVVMLHGAGGDQGSAMGRLFGEGRRPPPYDDHGYLVVTPDTRGILGWDGYVGEDDVLRVLADVQRTHAVDEDRIYLTGLSMGGGGTWYLGLRYPDLFAALAPVCAATTWRLFDETPVAGLTAAVRDELSPLTYAENALHLPIAIHHGEMDQSVRVEHARRMAARLRELAYPVQYTEYPGGDHDAWTPAYAEGRMFAWFGQHRRDPWPSKVVHVTANPRRYGRSYWVRIDALQTPHTLGRVTAEVIAGNRIVVHVDNVRQLSLRLDTPLLDPDQDVTVEVAGTTCYEAPPAGHGWLALQWDGGACTIRPDDTPAVGPPYAGLWGALFDYHVVVYGTRGPAAVTDRYRALAERLTRLPDRLRMALPVLADTTVTDDLQSRASLVLLGTPETNAILADLSPDLPLRWENGQPALGALRAGDGEALLFVYPHPRHPERRVLVLTAGSTEAIEQIRYIPRGAPECVVLGSDGAIQATGTFTRDWQPVE